MTSRQRVQAIVSRAEDDFCHGNIAVTIKYMAK